MISEQPETYAYYEKETNQNFQTSECFWIKFELCLEITFHATKTGNTDLSWKFWIALYVAENLPLIRTNKRHVIILIASNDVYCHKYFLLIVCNNSLSQLGQSNNKFAD